jgi:CDP-diacylglycerol--serine O-phosphatidyltransferase
MKPHSYIPDLLTLSNLLCGVLSMAEVSQGHVEAGAWFILAGAGFDFFDGLAARALKVSSELGKQLDSLADVVSFGAAPAFIGLHLSGALHGELGGMDAALSYAPLLIAAAAAYRLAKFNIDTRQTTGFLGLPTPANALYWVALALVAAGGSQVAGGAHYVHHLLGARPIAIASVVLAVLMLSELKLLAFKFSGGGFRQNWMRFVLALSGAVLLAWLRAEAVPIVLLLYIVLSTIENR